MAGEPSTGFTAQIYITSKEHPPPVDVQGVELSTRGGGPTQSASGGAEAITVIRGSRPKLTETFDVFFSSSSAPPLEGGVFACGPAPLLHDAQRES